MAGIKLSDVTDEDIAWVVEILGLPKDAFSPEKDGGARERILKSAGKTLDVSACPGSGKTTLLVAKLAILARNWPSRRKGICVLSHTNVAKEEIEKRLGGTEVGQALLSYPHHIGTIHGFVNEFLSLPWLRSKGYPIIAIDDDIVRKHRASSLSWEKHRQLKGWLNNKIENGYLDISAIVNSWVISSSEFDVSDKSGTPIFKNPGQSKEQLTDLVRNVTISGYHRHGEMFTWAKDLIASCPASVQNVRDRFPLLFLDEVQDNSEIQSSILHRIFIDGDSEVYRIRVGDSDQEIFDHAGESNKVKTDRFPSDAAEQVCDLPNSHRFGQSIAKLASPLSISKTKLVGQGPNNGKEKDEAHAIFLVDDDSFDTVLNAYGQYLLSVFDEGQRELDQLTFTAVGAVHRNKEGVDDKKPHNISHYSAEYDPDIASKDPKPNTFLQYVSAGHRLGEKSTGEGTGGESFSAVERIAMGLIQLAKAVSTQFDIRPRKRNHRFLLELLKDDKKNLDSYIQLVMTFAVKRSFPEEDVWRDTWKEVVIDVVTSISGVAPQDNHPFLRYPLLLTNAQEHTKQNRHTNTYSVESGGRKVNIRLGSIHSVKGETHTATLVLETYNNAHHLNMLLPFIKSIPNKKITDSLDKRLKLHYVAMTRPSHLLCLAMKKSAFENKEGIINQKYIDALKKHGWGKVGVVDKTGLSEWL
jgi:DNA helicase-2/ATP-dependent DNA helicase PcrA